MLVSPKNFQRYLQAQGWRQRREALKERGLYWFEHPTLRPRQIAFLGDEEAPDYVQSLELAAAKLAEIEGVTPSALLQSVQEAGNDALNFRVFGHQVTGHKLPFSFFSEAIQGVKELLLAGAHSVLSPRLYHPRMGRREALEFLDSTEFGQTAPGSFIFQVTCPVAETPSLFEESEPPLARRATLAVNQALQELSAALHFDALDELIEGEQKKREPVISANFCEALTRLQDEKLANQLDVAFQWALMVPPPLFAARNKGFRFKTEDFRRISEVGDALRAIQGVREDLFIATVESLNGTMGTDGRRFGEVIFRISTPDFERPVRARIHLSPEDYAKADKAHMTEEAYALFNGKLHPGRQPRILSDVDEIEWYVGGEELTTP